MTEALHKVQLTDRGKVENLLAVGFEGLKRIQEGAIQRIIMTLPKNLQESNGFSVLNWYFDTDYITSDAPFGVDLVVTDEVENFLPEGNAFHITSNLAAGSLSKGKPLLPPFVHGENNVSTHRGVGLRAAYALLVALGIPEYGPSFETSLGYKELFLFASKRGGLDAEQWVYEDRIGQWGAENDERITDLLYVDRKNGGLGRLHPVLFEIMTLLKKGEKLPEKEHRGYKKKLLSCLNETQGLRYRWLDRLSDVLNGNKKTEALKIWDTETLTFHLDMLLGKKVSYVSQPSRTVVLEFDPRKSLGKRGILILPLDDRNPETTAMVPEITPDSIVRVYSKDESDAYGLPWAPVDSLDQGNWIKGIKPQGVDLSRSDPSMALCGIKYGDKPDYAKDVVRLWEGPLSSGAVVPLLGLIPFSSENDSHLFKILVKILSDGIESEEKILTSEALSIIQNSGLRGLVYTLFDRHDRKERRRAKMYL